MTAVATGVCLDSTDGTSERVRDTAEMAQVIPQEHFQPRNVQVIPQELFPKHFDEPAVHAAREQTAEQIVNIPTPQIAVVPVIDHVVDDMHTQLNSFFSWLNKSESTVKPRRRPLILFLLFFLWTNWSCLPRGRLSLYHIHQKLSHGNVGTLPLARDPRGRRIRRSITQRVDNVRDGVRERF